MAPSIEVDEQTYRAIELAARLTGVTKGGVVARLVAQTIDGPSEPPPSGENEGDGGSVPIFADYNGHRTHAQYDPITRRVDVTSGALAGKAYKTPSQAAVAVVAHLKPDVNPNRNGWNFWTVEDGSGRRLQALRTTA